ncbi:MAG: hypothetical protein PVG39_23180 [Desulfobacteraceae bacterium]|jgi:hypothetical protein
MKKNLTAIITIAVIAFWFCPVSAYEVEDVNIHGFISQGYLQSSDNNFHSKSKDGTFEYSEIGINFSKELTDSLRLGMQLFSRDLGSNGNNEIKLDWAFGDYRWKDWLGVRVGKIKTPHGLYNETRDVDMLRNSVFLPQSVYSEILRDPALALQGVGIYGSIESEALGSFSYQAMGGTQNIEANETTSQALQGLSTSTTIVENDGFDVDHKYAFSLVWDTPMEGLRLSVTHSTSKIMVNSHITAEMRGNPAGTFIGREIKKLDNNVYSLEYVWNDLILVGEYIVLKKTQRLILDTDFWDWANTKSDGWYLGGAYRLAHWVELGSYYSESYNNADDRDGVKGAYDPNHRAYSKDLALTLRFDINDYWVIKLESHSIKGTNGISSLDISADPNKIEKDWNLFAAKTTFSF